MLANRESYQQTNLEQTVLEQTVNRLMLIGVRCIMLIVLLTQIVLLPTKLHAQTLSDQALKQWEKISPFDKKHTSPPPPEQKPFELPRLYSDKQHYNSPTEPLKKAPLIDPDAVFLTVMGCFPAKSAFNAELSLVGGYKRAIDEWDEGYPDISEHYIGIVGKIPLYSSNERARQREREYQRRNITAQQVAGFISAIAARNQAYRELGLYRALEARAQARVKNGIAETSEQITILEKLVSAHAAVITQQSKVTEYRLALAGLCEDNQREPINNWLKKLATL